MIVLEKNNKSTYLAWPFALVASLISTLLIVWLMTKLITPQDLNATVKKLLSIDFIQVNKTPALFEKSPVIDTPPSIPPSPPQVPSKPALKMQIDNVNTSDLQLVPITQPRLDTEIDFPKIVATELSAPPSIQKIEPTFDQELYPILSNEPTYPSRAKRAKIEGWVNVAFTITVEGDVKDIQILAAEPEGIFENSVVNTVKNWRFKPQMLSGKAQERRVVQTIEFKLQK
jgi:protein TonB